MSFSCLLSVHNSKQDSRIVRGAPAKSYLLKISALSIRIHGHSLSWYAVMYRFQDLNQGCCFKIRISPRFPSRLLGRLGAVRKVSDDGFSLADLLIGHHAFFSSLSLFLFLSHSFRLKHGTREDLRAMQIPTRRRR